jgi:hypothetical protein
VAQPDPGPLADPRCSRCHCWSGSPSWRSPGCSTGSPTAGSRPSRPPTPSAGLQLPWWDWPASPAWLFRLTEGLHVGSGSCWCRWSLAKLWSVIPKLFTAPERNPVTLLERLSLVLLVGSILFLIVTGLLNVQYDYVFGFSFYDGHYAAAWVFLASFALHVVTKLPTMVRSLRGRSLRTELATPLAATRPEPAHPLVAPDPDPPTMSRRGALALVGGGDALRRGTDRRPQFTDRLRSTALLLPRGPDDGARQHRAGRPERLPGQPHVRRVRHRPRRGRERLDADPDRRHGTGGTRPGGAGRAAAAHRGAADRLRRGLVDRAGVDGGAADRPGPRRGRDRPGDRGGAVGRSGEPVSPRSLLNRGQTVSPDSLLALRGQRRRAVTRPRVPGAADRPRRSPGCTTPSGS